MVYVEFWNAKEGKMCLARMNFIKGIICHLFGKEFQCRIIPRRKIIFD
jgi:hypothetical protein